MALLRSSSVHREAALLVEIPSLIYIYILLLLPFHFLVAPPVWPRWVLGQNSGDTVFTPLS